MTNVQLQENGWLSLSVNLRQHLGIRTGDRLELEVTTDGLVLRPTQPWGKASQRLPAVPGEQFSLDASEQGSREVRYVPSAPVQEQLVRRGPGRPRKQISAEPPGPVQERPVKRGPGRPRKQLQAEQLNLGELPEAALTAPHEDAATPARAAHLTFRSRGRDIKIGGRRKLSPKP